MRADTGADTWTFEGVACTVDHPYTVRDRLGEYTETIAAGAFDRSIGNDNNRVSMYVNHDWQGIPLATLRAGTLELRADPNLRVRAQLDPARPDVQTLRSAIKRGEMTEMSVGFNDVAGGTTWSDDYTERTVTETALREVSIVEQGANDATMAAIRSLNVDLGRIRQVDMDENEIRRAVEHLNGLLPHAEAPAEEIEEQIEETIARSGVVVSDALIELFSRKR